MSTHGCAPREVSYRPRMKRVLLALVLAACSSKSSAPTAPPAPREGSGAPVEDTEPAGSAAGGAAQGSAATGPGIGEKCGDGDACATGLSCVSYYGIAGARGPQFKTCEIKCEMQNKESVCPPDTKCTTIADGPGQVCR